MTYKRYFPAALSGLRTCSIMFRGYQIPPLYDAADKTTAHSESSSASTGPRKHELQKQETNKFDERRSSGDTTCMIKESRIQGLSVRDHGLYLQSLILFNSLGFSFPDRHILMVV